MSRFSGEIVNLMLAESLSAGRGDAEHRAILLNRGFIATYEIVYVHD
jgi:hypothetical protein